MPDLNETKKILLVDDDDFFLVTAEEILKKDYQVFIVKSGKEALELLYKGFAPNLIILDILMPNMDGWEIYNRLRAISFLQNVPIAFCTSLEGEEEEKHAFEIGVVDYLTKPYAQENLLKMVKKILGPSINIVSR